MYFGGFEFIIHEMVPAQRDLRADVELDDGSNRIETYPVVAWAVIQYRDPNQSADGGTARRSDLKRLNVEAVVPMIRIGDETTLAPLIDDPADGHFLKHYKVKRIRQ